MKINKITVIKQLRERMGFTYTQSIEIYKTLGSIISDHLVNGDSVILPEIGILKPYKRKERNGVNPITKEFMIIPSRMRVSVCLSKHLRKRFKN